MADAAVLPAPMLWFIRIGVPVSAILISAGFFFSVLPPDATRASGAVSLIYAGALLLHIPDEADQRSGVMSITIPG
jgi:hypothetical protein